MSVRRSSSEIVIYVITNLLNGKRYVGQTNNFDSRIHYHMNYGKLAIGKAIKKHGKHNFIAEKIDSTFSPEKADEIETELIKRLNTIAPNGYNILPTAYGNRGRKGYKVKLSYPQREAKRKLIEKAREQRSPSNKTYKVTHPNGKTETIDNLKQFCAIYGLDYTKAIQTATGKKRHCGGYVFRYSHQPFADPITGIFGSNAIAAVEIATGKTLNFPSQREAAKHYNCSPAVVSDSIKKSRPTRSGVQFRLAD